MSQEFRQEFVFEMTGEELKVHSDRLIQVLDHLPPHIQVFVLERTMTFLCEEHQIKVVLFNQEIDTGLN